MSFQKSEIEVFSGGECGEEEMKEEEETIAFVSLNVCLESEFFSTKVSKDPSRNAWDPCPAELKNRLCMKCNPPALCGIWQVFTATLIQEYLVLCLFSPLHICLHDIQWPTGCTRCTDKPQGTAYKQPAMCCTLRRPQVLSLLLPASWGSSSCLHFPSEDKLCSSRALQWKTPVLPSLSRKSRAHGAHFPSLLNFEKRWFQTGLSGSTSDTVSGKANPSNK